MKLRLNLEASRAETVLDYRQVVVSRASMVGPAGLRCAHRRRNHELYADFAGYEEHGEARRGRVLD